MIPNNLRPGSDRFDRRERRGGYNDRGRGDRRDDRRGGYNKDRREGKPYDRERRGGRDNRGSSYGAKPAAKRTPYFGTYLGNSNAAKTEEENKSEE